MKHFTAIDSFDFGDAVAELMASERSLLGDYSIEQQQRCWDKIWDERQITTLTLEECEGWSESPTTNAGKCFKQWRNEAESYIEAVLSEDKNQTVLLAPRQ